MTDNSDDNRSRSARSNAFAAFYLLLAFAGILLPRLAPFIARALDHPPPSVTVAGSTEELPPLSYRPEENARATSARLSYPTGVALDLKGNLYVADLLSHTVWKVTPEGVLSAFAGTGQSGFSGDGGAAANAELHRPFELLTDREGNVFIADAYNHRIRRVDPQGTITTVAGNGRAAFSGDGGPAVKASLNTPCDMAFDAQGNLYFADCLNHRIRKVSPQGTISTVAGTGSAGYGGDGGPAIRAALTSPESVEVDARGDLYIGDSGNDRIRKVDGRGIISTVAGEPLKGWRRLLQTGLGDGGSAFHADLHRPQDLYFDEAGNLFFSDRLNNRVRKIASDGRISTVMHHVKAFRLDSWNEENPGESDHLREPKGVWIDPSGNLYLADAMNNKVRKLSGVAAPGLFNGRRIENSP